MVLLDWHKVWWSQRGAGSMAPPAVPLLERRPRVASGSALCGEEEEGGGGVMVVVWCGDGGRGWAP